jgi:hypothetical protein
MKSLQTLNLEGNPVASAPQYRIDVFKLQDNLKVIDGQ